MKIFTNLLKVLMVVVFTMPLTKLAIAQNAPKLSVVSVAQEKKAEPIVPPPANPNARPTGDRPTISAPLQLGSSNAASTNLERQQTANRFVVQVQREMQRELLKSRMSARELQVFGRPNDLPVQATQAQSSNAALASRFRQFSGTLDLSDPTFNRPLSISQGGTCGTSGVGTAVHYDTYTFTKTTSSNVTISIVPADGASISPGTADTFIALYGPGGFNPATPCSNFIASNDDASGALSRITTTTPLAPGVYTIVFTSFDNTPTDFPWTYNLVVIDTDPVPVTINQAAGQADPTGASPINFTVTFTEPMNGFATGDITLGGTAGATTATVTGGPTTYNVAVSGMTANGTVTASIAAGVAASVNNASPNEASTSTDNSVTYNGIPAGPTCNFTGRIENTDASASDRIYRNGVSSSCASPKAFPGMNGVPGIYNFDTYSIINTTGANQCVTFSLTSPDVNVHLIAYAGSFNPANQAQNYLGDIGSSSNLGTVRSMDINIPNGQLVVLVAIAAFPGELTASNYTINVVGLPCMSNCQVSCPANMTVSAPVGTCTAAVTFPLTCGTSSPLPGSIFPLGVNTVNVNNPGVEALLFDQTTASYGSSDNITSQNFETAFDAFDSWAADDFTVPAGQTWKLTKVAAFGATTAPTSFNVVFYQNTGGLPGTAIATYNNITIPATLNPVLTLPTPLTLTAGTYWVSIQANMAHATGQWYWNEFGTTANGIEHAWQNPGGGFGTTCTSWNVINTCITGHKKNLALQLFGLIPSSCSFTVTVTPTCPSNITVPAAAGVCLAPVNFTVPPCATSTHASGSNFPVGTTNVTFTYNQENTLVDQTAATYGAGDDITSQNFEPANDNFDTWAADDFTVPAGETWKLTKVAAFGVSIAPTTFNVVFYQNNAGLPGTVIATYNGITIAASVNPVLTLPSTLTLTAGTYWVSIQADMSTASGQWFWREFGTTAIGAEHAWQNPGGGFGTSCSSWNTINTCIANHKKNLAFQVIGSIQYTCTFAVTVTDSQNPTITCPANMTANTAAGICTASVATPNPATGDNCGVTALTWAMTGATTGTSPATGINNLGTQTFNRGVTTVTYTVKDAAGNTTTCSFTVTVNDNQNPTITCPGNMTANAATGFCNASLATPNPTTADNCGVTVLTWVMTGATVAASPATGINNVGTYSFNVGVTTVTYTVKDAQGNTVTCSFTVTVSDTQAPTITCPANINVSNDPDLCSAVVSYSLPAANDNCNKFQVPANILAHGAGAITVAGNNAPGGFLFNLTNNSTSPKTVTGLSVRFGSTAAGGVAVPSPAPVSVWITTSANTYVGNQTNQAAWTNIGTNIPVTVAGANAEFSQFSLPGNGFTLAPGQTKGVFVFGTSSSLVYNSGANSSATPITNGVLTLTPGEARGTAFGGTALTPRIPNVIINYITMTQTAGLPSGSAFPVGTTTNSFTATDDAGNSSTCSFTVKVNDTQIPTITCPANITVNTPLGSCTAVVNYSPVISDNCPGATLVLVSGPASGSAFPIGTTTIVVKARDAAGNLSAACSFTVTVNDAQLPVISTQPQDKVICTGQNVTFTVASSNVVSYQWQVLTGNTWTDIAGATSSSYSFTANVADNNKKYRVLVRGLCTTVISREADLRVNSLPVVTLGSYYGAIWPGMTTTVTAAASAWGGNYQFYFNGNAVGTASTNNVYGPVGVDGIGTYDVLYTDVNGCSARATTTLVLGGKPSDVVFVYPNPNNGNFQVRFNNVSGEQASVLVFNSAGQIVFKKAFTNGTATYSRMDVNLGLTAGGMYEVKVVGKDNRVFGSTKVFIKR